MANEGEQWRYHLRLDMEFDDPEAFFDDLKELIEVVDAAQAEHIEQSEEERDRALSFNGLTDCEHQHGYFGIDVRPVWPGREVH